jgi:VIT1/CCC1 family predicted Fe2+/Mn2+ transporter
MSEPVSKILESWHEEQTAAYLYAKIIAVETGVNQRLFESLRAASLKQAGLWEAELGRRGAAAPPFYPGLRPRLAAALLGLIHPRHMLPMLAAMKVRGLGIYRSGQVVAGEGEGGEPALIASPAEERRHRANRGGGALRAAVFGVNDGLVSNTSLIIGMTGAGADAQTIVVSGIAGLLAGGFSMAAGEYISVRTQREVYEQQIALEREEIAAMPEEEIAELAEIYHAKGLSYDQANALARRMISDPEKGLEALSREELGLDPGSLGSPWAAAGSSFAAFVGGAIIPLVPHLLFSGPAANWATVGLAAGGLMSIGAVMSLFTGKSALWSALRMAAIGAMAGGATFAIGSLFGVATG